MGWGFSILLLIPAGILIAAGVIGVANGLASTARAAGTITSVGKDCHGIYTDATGNSHSFTHYGDKSYCGNEYRAGQVVTVFYDPKRPSVADTSSPVYTVVVHALLAVVGLLFTVPVVLMTAAIRRGKRVGRQPLARR